MRKRLLEDVKGMAMVAVVVGMMMFAAMGLTVASFVTTDLDRATEGMQAAQAFYVAEGGRQFVIMSDLNGDTDFSDNISPTDPPFGADSITLSPGEFWIEYVAQASDSATLRITARVGDAVRVINQSVGQGGTGEQYVTMSSGNINMNSSSGDIFGDVALGGNYSIDEDVTIHGNIIEDDDLVMPTFDFPTYEAMCDTTHSGNLTISANYTGDLCVTGNVRIDANVTFTGLLYSNGNVTINGNNVVFNGSLVAEGNINGDNRTGLQFTASTPSPDVHMPAIVGDGNVDFKDADGMQVTGVMWNSGNIDFTNTDNLDYTGAFMVGGNVVINSASSVTVTFDADLLAGVPGLEGAGGSESGSVSLSGWSTY